MSLRVSAYAGWLGLFACYALAAWQLVRTGLSVAVLVGGTALVAAVNLIRWQIGVSFLLWASETVEVDETNRPDLHEAVAEVADRLGIDRPTVLLSENKESAMAIRRPSGHVLLLSRSLTSSLDRDAVRGFVAHELGHVVNGHLVRSQVARVVSPIFGFAVFWTIFLSGASETVRLAGGGFYFAVWLLGTNGRFALIRLLLSLFAEFVPMVAVFHLDRVQEYEADQTVAAVTDDAEAFVRGLIEFSRQTEAEVDVETETAIEDFPSFSSDRTLFDALFAEHPPVDRRADRLGIRRDDESGTSTDEPVVSTDD